VKQAFEPFTGDVIDLRVSVVDRAAYVEHRSGLDPSKLVEALNDKRLGASLKDAGEAGSAGSGLEWRAKVGACRVAAQVALFLAGGRPDFLGQQVSKVALVLCVLLSYGLFYKAALAVAGARANVELLMSLAMVGSLAQLQLPEAAMVGVIVALLDGVTMATMHMVNQRLSGCMTVPQTEVTLADQSKVLAAEVKVGTVFLVRAGEAIAADGTVVTGKGTVDESRLTGEAEPIQKLKGSTVRSGALLQAGFLEVRADAEVDASFQARITQSVQHAKDTMSNTQEVVGKFAAWYTPSVIVLAVIVALVQRDFRQFLVIIVAGCPCALLGAAPFTHAAALAVLAKRHGLLLKETAALESLARLEWLGVDKTGTITTGQFTLVEMRAVGKYTQKDLLRWAASIESKDNHPLAQSLVQSYTGCVAEFQGSGALPAVSSFKRQGRCGVMGVVENQLVGVGNIDFLKAQDIPLEGKAAQALDDWCSHGTVLFVTVEDAVAGVLLMADALRGDARGTITRLKDLGVVPVLLTGDKGPAAHAAAAAAGIDQVHFDLLPDDKTTFLLKASHGAQPMSKPLVGRGPREVGFIGDGLNDCPALASAHIGIVMQEIGAAATVEAASAVLQGDIGHLPAAVVVARRTQRLIVANICLAMAINAAVILAAAFVGIPLWMSVVADSGSLLAVLMNSLWPLCWRLDPVPDGSGKDLANNGGSTAFPARGPSEMFDAV